MARPKLELHEFPPVLPPLEFSGAGTLKPIPFDSPLPDTAVRNVDVLNGLVLQNWRDARRNARTEEQLRNSEDKFAKAFHASPLAMSISTREEGRYIDVNDAFLEMLGFERRHVIGRTAADLDFWAEPGGRAQMLSELAEGRPVKLMPAKFRNSSGEPLEGTVSAEIIELDGIPCVLAITQDVTETRQLERQLRQAQKMEAVGQMVSGIAHDFNNMLSVIMGYSDLALQNKDATNPDCNNLVQIKKAAERAASLIRQLLGFSRERGFCSRVLDLNATVTGLNQMLDRTLGEHIQLSFRPSSAPVYVEADLGQIEQVVMNLILNARDAMPKGGHIRVETGLVDVQQAYVDGGMTLSPGHYATLSVSDDGCGMDKGTVDKIFEPFFTTKTTGTGLGLATVRDIVRRCGGQISVHSRPGQGTTFCLYFSSIEERDGQAPKLKTDVHARDGRGESVLVVEDNSSVRALITAILCEAGYQPYEAATPQLAIELFESHADEFDVVLSDGIMPAMSGGELAALLRLRNPGLKCVLMSGYSADVIAQYGTLGSGIEFIEKPFTRNELLAKIYGVLHRRKKVLTSAQAGLSVTQPFV